MPDVLDPNTPTPTQGEPDPTADAVVAQQHEEVDDVAAALDEGIEEATETPATPEEPVPGTPEALAAEAAKTEADATAKPDAEAKPEDDGSKEADSLGLKGKANERFRELTSQVKELAPIKAAMEQAGIKDIAELPKMIQHARDGADIVGMVQETGASPEQFGQTLDYLGLVTKAGTGDRAAAEQAFALVEGEYKELAKALGKEVPGVYDPLAEHAELQAEVQSGDITRARALELAAQRETAKRMEAARTQQAQQTQQQQEQEAKAKEARTSAAQALNALEQELIAADPQYMLKRPALLQKVQEIQQQFPPAQWASATKLAYAGIPAPATASTPSPMRPGGPRPAVTPATFDSPEDALEAALLDGDG